MSRAGRPQGPWWRVWLLGALVPFLVAAPITVVLREIVTYALDDGHIAIGLFSPAWFGEVGLLLAKVALVFLAIQAVVIAIMATLERSGPKPPPLWLLSGVIATTPLVLYLLWPNGPVHPMFVLAIYGLGMAGAAIGRRIRHGGRWE